MCKRFLISAKWDPDAGVWVATSDSVPGLATEADSVEVLKKKLDTLVPELLELNGDHLPTPVSSPVSRDDWDLELISSE